MTAICMFCAAGCGAAPAAAEETAELPALHVEEGSLRTEDGKEIQLRGVSTHGIAWYGEYLNASAMQSVKAAGGNVVRIAMYTDGEGGYAAQPDVNLKRVLCGIEDAAAAGLYVIVDWHILSDGDPGTHLSEAITFFDAIASRYPDSPNILYEVCNEPNGVTWSVIKDYAYAIVPVIRQYNENAVILLGTPNYCKNITDAVYDPFPAENIMYTFHYYAGESSGYEALDEALKENVPVFVSEWGIGEYGADDGSAFADYLNKNGISWCAWSLCNKDEAYSLLRPDSRKLGAFQEEDLTETGKMIFDKLTG